MGSHASYKTVALLGERILLKSTKYSKHKMLKMLLLLDTHQNSICLDTCRQSIASSQATILM